MKLFLAGCLVVTGLVAVSSVEAAGLKVLVVVGADGIDYAGPYPGDLQSYIVFSAGVSAKARDAETAKAFVKFLSAPAAAPIIKKHSMDAG